MSKLKKIPIYAEICSDDEGKTNSCEILLGSGEFYLTKPELETLIQELTQLKDKMI